MTHELAKQLKDSGYPQGDWQDQLICRHGIGLLDECETVTIPNLSELIEACGDGFYRLQKQGKKYLAYPTIEVIANETGWIEVSEQETPEIAVAKLWLAINRKD